MAQPIIETSVHVSGGDVAECHDRREYTPPNAERSLRDRNVMLLDVGDYAEAVNAEFRDAILKYNKKQKRPDRHKSFDYYGEVSKSKQQQPVYELVVGIGRRETCGVCVDPFDQVEYDRLLDEDEETGGHAAADYDTAHFSEQRWLALKAENEDAASEYVLSRLATGAKGEAHDLARQILLEVGEALIKNRANKYGVSPLPKGFKLLMVVLHDDEPAGTPHLHVTFCPIAENYKRGLEKRIGLAKALEEAGYEGRDAMPKLYEHVRTDVMVPILGKHDVRREYMNNHEMHYSVATFKEERRYLEAVECRREAQKELSDVFRELERVEEEVRDAEYRRDMAIAKRDAASDYSLRCTLMANESRERAARADAYVEVAENGYEPPVGATLIPPKAMSEELRELWRYIYEDEEDATYLISDELWPPDGEPDVDAIYDRAAELEEGLVAEYGADTCYVNENGVWLVTVPEDYVTEDGRAMDELDEAERSDAVDDYIGDEVSGKLAIANRLRYDPAVPHPPLREREQKLEEREHTLAAREEQLNERSANIDSELAEKRRELKLAKTELEATNRAIEARNADLAEANAKLDRANRDAASVHTTAITDAQRITSAAERDASSIRATAERDAESARERANAEADEVVRSASRRWGDGPFKVLSRMLDVAGQFCAQRSRDVGDAWSRRANVLREAGSVLYELANHDRANVRESFLERFEQKLVEYDREQRSQSVTCTPTAYSSETPRHDERQLGDS